jgi:hypothetical protein
MPIIAITRSSSSRRRHVVHAAGASSTPRCGGGRGARAQTGWQRDFGDADAISCIACLRILIREANANAAEAT